MHFREKLEDYNLSSYLIKNFDIKKYLIEDGKHFDITFFRRFTKDTWGDQSDEFYKIMTPIILYGLLSQTYSINQAYSLSLEYEYDVIIKSRPDLIFTKDIRGIISNLDLSGNNNNGVLNECEMVGYTFDDSKIIEIPFRRNSTFKLLAHDENGYANGSWKNITTRYNQLKYHNEVAKGYKDPKFDGLSNLEYKEHTFAHTNNQTHVLVGI
jgi:hypothetical protein